MRKPLISSLIVACFAIMMFAMAVFLKQAALTKAEFIIFRVMLIACGGLMTFGTFSVYRSETEEQRDKMLYMLIEDKDWDEVFENNLTESWSRKLYLKENYKIEKREPK